MTPEQDKNALRRKLRRRRAATPPELVQGWSAAVCARVAALDAWRSASAVHLFVGALPGEVRTETLAHRALAEGKILICPRTLPAPQLAHHRVSAWSDLIPSRYGLLEPNPASTEPVDPSAADLILVPGLGFDQWGARIGMGGGYYDHLLASMDCPRLGLTFEWQLLSRIPTLTHDQRVDGIVTELRLIEPWRSRE